MISSLLVVRRNGLTPMCSCGWENKHFAGHFIKIVPCEKNQTEVRLADYWSLRARVPALEIFEWRLFDSAACIGSMLPLSAAACLIVTKIWV